MLSIILPKSIHVATNGNISLFFVTEYIHIHTLHTFFFHSFVDGSSGCFHVLAIINGVALNIGKHLAFQISVLVLSRYILGIGIAESHGGSVLVSEDPPYHSCC